MVLTFEILHLSYHHNRGQFIFARLLDKEIDLEIKDAILGGIPVYNYSDMPKHLDDNGEPRLDIFTFQPIEPMQKADFVPGQRVDLVLTD